MPKIFNTDVRITGWGELYVNEVKVVDKDGNIDAPVTATTLTSTGNGTVWGNLAVTGTSTLTGAVTATAGIQAGAVAVTAVATTGAAIPAWSTFVSVTSDNADKIVKLPTPVLWNIIYIQEASAVGFEVRPAAETQFINGTECSSGKELAMAAGVWTWVFICTVGWAAGKWTQYFIDEDGTIDAGWTPD